MMVFVLVGLIGEFYKEGVGVYGLFVLLSGIVYLFCFFVVGVKLWVFGKCYGYLM